MMEFIRDNINSNEEESSLKILLHSIYNELGQGKRISKFASQYSGVVNLINTTLDDSWRIAKHEISIEFDRKDIVATGKIKVVVFDFDGTLAMKSTDKSSWENLWIISGYKASDCQKLHDMYNNKEISHEDWCELTLNKFRERKLSIQQVIGVADKIQLLDGTQDALRIIREKEIRIYIVSGSIDTIIEHVLGDVKQYIDEIISNHFEYDEDGIISNIEGTKNDFEGKAFFISEKSKELKISTQDVLFVGNSWNDIFVHSSGAKTLCINPRLTDPTDKNVWNASIVRCDNLCEIMPYINGEIDLVTEI